MLLNKNSDVTISITPHVKLNVKVHNVIHSPKFKENVAIFKLNMDKEIRQLLPVIRANTDNLFVNNGSTLMIYAKSSRMKALGLDKYECALSAQEG